MAVWRWGEEWHHAWTTHRICHGILIRYMYIYSCKFYVCTSMYTIQIPSLPSMYMLYMHQDAHICWHGQRSKLIFHLSPPNCRTLMLSLSKAVMSLRQPWMQHLLVLRASRCVYVCVYTIHICIVCLSDWHRSSSALVCRESGESFFSILSKTHSLFHSRALETLNSYLFTHSHTPVLVSRQSRIRWSLTTRPSLITTKAMLFSGMLKLSPTLCSRSLLRVSASFFRMLFFAHHHRDWSILASPSRAFSSLSQDVIKMVDPDYNHKMVFFRNLFTGGIDGGPAMGNDIMCAVRDFDCYLLLIVSCYGNSDLLLLILFGFSFSETHSDSCWECSCWLTFCSSFPYWFLFMQAKPGQAGCIPTAADMLAKCLDPSAASPSCKKHICAFK